MTTEYRKWKPLIYVAGPITKGDSFLNVVRALDAAEQVVQLGGTPIVPQMDFVWHMRHPHSHDFWVQNDLQVIYRCDAVFRLQGESVGADMEEAFARECGIPVLQDWQQLKKFVNQYAEDDKTYQTLIESIGSRLNAPYSGSASQAAGCVFAQYLRGDGAGVSNAAPAAAGRVLDMPQATESAAAVGGSSAYEGRAEAAD